MGLKELNEISDLIKKEVEATVQDEVKSAISAFGSIINRDRMRHYGILPVYASSPITTGWRMYSMLENAGVQSLEELKAIDPEVRSKLIKANIDDGIEFGDDIRAQGHPIVIVPGVFFAKYWTQEHYMGLWEPIIVDDSDIVGYNSRFHYSDGCVEEFLIGLREDKQLRRREGFSVISPKDEIPKLEDAMRHIEKITGVTPPKLYNSYQKIIKLI